MTDACDAIDAKIKECGGLFNIKMAPKVVTATDEADLAKQMERAEMENAEVCYHLTRANHIKLNACGA